MLVVGLGVAVQGSAQTLGQAAERERLRRQGQAVRDPVRVVTDLELQSYDTPDTPHTPDTPDTPDTPETPAATEPAGRAPRPVWPIDPASVSGDGLVRQQSHRERLAICRARLAYAEQVAAAGGVRRIVCPKKNPTLRGSGMNAEEARQQVVTIRRECEEIEDDARRRGIPPGDLR